MHQRFSVIIPTRERVDTLEKTLQTVTAQNYDNLEILVSDNCSTDGTRDVVMAANDPRVRYVRTGHRVSMSENWEFALSKANGDWVTIIGDDDGLMLGCIEKISELASETGSEAITTSTSSFLWPALTGRRSGVLSVPVGDGWEWRASAAWRTRVLAGRASYPSLPILYTGGFVAAAAVQRARMKHGRFYRSCIPDVYSTMALSAVLSRYVYSWEPVTVSGLSRHSTGYSQFTSAAGQADARTVEMFLREGNIPFHRDVPIDADGHYPRSIQVMTLESYLQVRAVDPEAPPVSHQDQLTVILATAREHHAAVHAWGQRFAALHNLDFASAAATARRHSIALRVRALPAALGLMTRIHTIGSDTLLLRDVYDASVAASAIQRLKPSKVRHVAGKIRARLLRAIGSTTVPR